MSSSSSSSSSSSTSSTERVTYEVLTKRANNLIRELANDQLTVPAHQRKPLLWTDKAKQKFVKSVQENIPTTGLLQREYNGKTYLEDGLQRLSTLRSYFNDEFCDENGLKFSELSEDLKEQMKNYEFAVIRYKNASPDTAIRIFDNAQNGMPLSVGQRMHSLRDYPSPLVDLAYRILLTPESELYERAIPIWGKRDIMDPKCNTLVNAVVLLSGLHFGHITKKWLEIQHLGILYEEIDAEAEESIKEKLRFLLSIYEEVNNRAGRLASKTQLNSTWNIGNTLGYIAWSIYKFPEDREQLRTGWVNWLLRYRKNSMLIDSELKADLSAARSWNEKRWSLGYTRVFHPERFTTAVQQPALESDEEDYDDDDDC